MDTPPNARKPNSRGQMLRDLDLYPGDIADIFNWSRWSSRSDASPERLAAIFEAVAGNDKTKIDTVLRRWGIRR